VDQESFATFVLIFAPLRERKKLNKVQNPEGSDTRDDE
jgi:hypothetical protein